MYIQSCIASRNHVEMLLFKTLNEFVQYSKTTAGAKQQLPATGIPGAAAAVCPVPAAAAAIPAGVYMYSYIHIHICRCMQVIDELDSAMEFSLNSVDKLKSDSMI